MHLHRPAPATVISLIALFFAMSGTAVAATGGNFLLGKSNTATAVTSLTNTKGTALKLSSTSTTPPLTVGNSVQVPNLNASELGGTPASGFLGVNGTAANSSELGGTPASGYLGVNGTAANSDELGGIPASGFIQGDGTVNAGRLSLAAGAADSPILTAPGITLTGSCEIDSIGSSIFLSGSQGQAAWFNKDGVGQGNLTGSPHLTPYSTSPYVVVAQVDTGSNIETFTATQSYDSGTSTCSFTGQVVTSNG